MPPKAPRGTVTFLFTDIEDSSRRWDEDPSEMAEALRVHDAILRGSIERHDGYVFSTERDGFGAAFPTAAGAIAAAVDAQVELRDSHAIDFAVRMGLHTGEAIERDRTYVGLDVNRAARLMSIAHGGQVLVSETTEAMVRDRVALRLLGRHRMRGVRGRTSVYQVIAQGLRADFPTIGRQANSAGNLPPQLSTFIGRDNLVGEVADSVRDNRLVTLTGVGGVGKTRLATEVGAEMAEEFPDGVWLIELAPVTDEGSVSSAMATLLGVAPQGDGELVDTLAEALSTRQLLLVVDNCEHVLSDAASTIAAILDRATHVRVLATSREGLALSGELAIAVPPLAYADGEFSDAVALFVDRAVAVRPDFAISDPLVAAAVTEICQTVDGLPLGIELAAARMSVMTPLDVRDRLTDRFRLLERAAPGPHRQQTLHHAIEWSYDLLTNSERALLQTTSVFAGGFDLTSIVALMRNVDSIDVLRDLESLVRKSLIAADHTGPRTRYSLFETIRQFAENQLAQRGGAAHMRDAHAAFFADAAVSRWATWEGPGWREAVDWVDLELGNLRAAYQWSASRGQVEVAADVAAHAGLMGFSVQLFETLAWAEAVLDAASAADVRRLPRLYTAAGYACFAGRAEAARASAHRATELEIDPRYESCPPGYASFIEALASVYCGDLARYVELTGLVAGRYGRERGYALAAYVDGLQSAGRVDEALALAEESVAVARSLGNPYWIAYSLWIAGMAFSRNEPRRAFAAWDEAMMVVREHRVHFFEGFVARDSARLHTTHGEPTAALNLLAQATAVFQRAGNIPQLVITLASVPALFERIGRLEPAATLLGALANQPSSAHHVPELAELAARIRRELGARRASKASAESRSFDLADTATYARQQIDAARRDPVATPRAARPGGLSRRELEVLRLVADGMSAGEIATTLFISTRTAEHHVSHIYTKIGVANRAAATRWALKNGVVDPVGDA